MSVMVGCIQSVREEFLDKGMFQSWGIIDKRVIEAIIGDLEYPSLFHSRST